MSDVVFILGAGSSKEAGAPLMADFLDVATDLHRAGVVKDKHEHYERVFSVIGGLQLVHSKAQLDLNNLESIFTALELGNIIKRVPGLAPEEIPVAIASLKEVILKTLEATIGFPANNDYIKPPKPYEEFADLVKYLTKNASPKRSVAVITFNYDICADIALYRQNLGPDYVIERAPGSQGTTVELLKLHGSLNWATEKGSRRIRPLHMHHFLEKINFFSFEERSTFYIPIGQYLVEYFQKIIDPPIEVEQEPVIVPPTWNKAEYHYALSDVWARAAEHLSEAESIFIIGYSLPETDSFFRHLYTLGSVGKTPLRHIYVFNPDRSGVTEKRFRELIGPGAEARFKYIDEPFGISLKHIRQLFPNQA